MPETPDGWQDVFNSAHHMWGHVRDVQAAAAIARYPFFAFNGRVYRTNAPANTWRVDDAICLTEELT